MTDQHLHLAKTLAARFSLLPEVEAVALAGSYQSGFAGASSDIDVYVYSRTDIPADTRMAIGAEFADDVELVDYWGPGSEWTDRETGIHVDVIFWTRDWIEEQLDRTLRRHQAWMGYSTAFWHTIRISLPLFDRNGWFVRLQKDAHQPYPEPLVKAIIQTNLPLLRRISSSYLRQLEKAAARCDLVSLNHRTAALLASYFDILFAVNRIPHPGEKRQLDFAESRCTKLPIHMRQHIETLIHASANPDSDITVAVNQLIDSLETLLASENLLV